MTDMLAEPLDRLLGELCPPKRIRAILQGEPLDALWGELAELGYQDACVEEAQGGAGLGLTDLFETLLVLGRRLCPVPLGETMVARGLLAANGIEAPDGAILLLRGSPRNEGGWSAPSTPLGLAADHGLLDLGGRTALVALDTAVITPSFPGLSLAADIDWAGPPDVTASFATPPGLGATAAALRAATIAGLASGVLDLTIGYAATRRQFGKAIIDFQAIQQQVAVLAEEVGAASMAAAIGCTARGPLAEPFDGAVAKMRTSVAAQRVAEIGHAVHGAIGISEEYDLQLFTRRLAEERLADGSEGYWADQIGRMRMADAEPSGISFVRSAATKCRSGGGGAPVRTAPVADTLTPRASA